MKARNKTAVIHDYTNYQLSQEHVDYLLEIFEMKMKGAASIGVRSATFSTDDVAIAAVWGVTSYELKMELLVDTGLWLGQFYPVGQPNKALEAIGGLE